MNALVLSSMGAGEEWPEEAEDAYGRVEVLGRGSYGLVWMARRAKPVKGQDEYVAIKNIHIKDEKSRIYARREISILSELKHPNIVGFIHEYPVHKASQLVVLQLARGPNLQSLVSKRGALGIPLSRLVSRHLIAAVSYMHGRAVLHRDIKPTNCILESTQARVQDGYDWNKDNAIWSNGPDAEAAVAANKWKLVVIDFGFARALTRHELESQKAPMRQSILKEIENKSFADIAKLVAEETHNESLSKKNADGIRRASFFQERVEHPEITSSKRRLTTYSSGISKKALDTLNEDDDGKTNVDGNQKKEHRPVRKPRSFGRLQNPLRQSTTRTKLRSMSALGTKAYAAPEIKNDLRNKTQDDVDYQYQALTKCVADYGMIVDAYSVGWTIRVIMTGVPPSSTISEYLEKRSTGPEDIFDSGCCCWRSPEESTASLRLCDVDELPRIAVHLISQLTMTNPEDRMTVREAQIHPWIRGREDEEPYELPEGDIPTHHGDPVVPLKCAGSLPATELRNSAKCT